MKKRILSLLLAVAMLFSCLSLNIFATDGAEAAATETTPGTVITNTLAAHTDAQIKAYIDTLTDSKFMFHDGTTRTLTGVNLNDEGTRFTVTEDGRLVVGPAVTAGKEAHFNLEGHSDVSGRTNVLKNYKANAALHGQSFVVQADIELTDYFISLNTTQNLLQITTYAGYGTYNKTTSRPKAFQLNFLKIKGDQLIALKSNNSTWENVATLEANKSYTVAVHVNPKDVDEAAGIYGSYDVYVNGALVAERLGFLSAANNKTITMPEDIPYFIDSVYSDNANSILKAGQTAYFFTDTAPDTTTDSDEDGIPDIYEGVCGITADTVPTSVELIGTAKGVADFALAGLRFFQMSTSVVHTENAFYLDNAMVYRADEYVNVLEHDLVEGTHAHDYTKATTDVTYTCTACEGYKVVAEAIDANGDRVCDICLGELESGGILSADQIANYADVIYTSDIGLGQSTTDHYGVMSKVTEENGNVYVKIGTKTKDSTSTDIAYTHTGLPGYSYPYQIPSINNFETAKGKSYVMSADMKLFDTMVTEGHSYFGVLGAMSYLKGSDGCTSIGALSVIYFLAFDLEGYVLYRDGATGAYVKTDINIKDGEFHTLAVHHTPAEVGAENTYDAYVDGKLIAENVQALTASEDKALTFESGTLAPHNNIAYAVDSVKVNGAVDFVPTVIRTNNYPNALIQNAEGDQFAYDNLKFYYTDTFFEHYHDYKLSHTHDLENGKNLLTYTCSVCGLEQNASLKMSDGQEPGEILTPSELSALVGSNALVSSEMTDDLPLGGLSKTDNRGMIASVVDEETGNRYIKYGATTVSTGTGGCYVQKVTPVSGHGNVLKNYTEYAGRSYVVTADMMHYGNANISLYDIISYSGGTNGATTTTSTVAINPVAILTDGRLVYSASGANINYEEGTANYTETGVVFDPGKFYTVTFHHKPTENKFDLYVDGVCVAKDVTALNQTKINSGTFTLASPITDNSENTVTGLNGATDFSPGIIRFSQMWGASQDRLALDNVKIYYSDVNYDCVHSYKDSVCEWCGKVDVITHCDICNGKVISENVAVTGKSVSLGELIDVNVYMALNERLVNTEGAKVVLTAGEKTAEFALADAVKGDNGSYKFSIALNSIEMATEVTASIVGEEAEAYTTSVKAYAEQLIANSTSSAEKNVAKALLNFGAAAQEYFAEKNADSTIADVLANAGLDEADKAIADLTAETLEAYKFAAEGTTADVDFTALSLILSSKTYMKVYFTASADATVTVNGKAYDKYEEDGEYYITVTVSTPANATNAFEIAVTDGEVVATASISAMSAVVAGVNNAQTDAKLVTLLKAYAEYASTAAIYKA